MSGKGIRLALAASVAFCALAFAGAAHASSIVFIRGGDIWLTTPDGTREHRVTSGESFASVTQADDGTIYAWRQGQLLKYDQNGRQLQPPETVLDMFDLDVAPDGQHIAFWYALYDGGHFDVIRYDGAEAGWDDDNGSYPVWINDSVVLRSNDAGYLTVQYRGNGNSYAWTGEPDGRKFGVDITRARDRLVAVVQDYEGTGPWTVAHYSNTSTPPTDDEGHILQPPPPAEQPTLRCTVDYGPVQPVHPRFSPDGSAIAWELPDGVHVQPVLDLNSCAQPPGGFTIAGAESPDWGPADLPAPAAPMCVVPKLKGKTLKRAKRLLKAANCRLGKVTKRRSRKKAGTVIKQRPSAGKQRAAGARVRVVLARRR